MITPSNNARPDVEIIDEEDEWSTLCETVFGNGHDVRDQVARDIEQTLIKQGQQREGGNALLEKTNI